MNRIIALALLGLLVSPAALAQNVNVNCLTGTSSTGAPLWQPASAANPCPTTATISGSVTANSSATASANPTTVTAGTGRALNESLSSELYVQPSINGTQVPAGHGVAAAAMRVELPTDGTGVVGLNAGSNVIGKMSIDQTTPGTTNAVQPIPGTSGGLSISRLQVAANTTSVAIKASAGQLYGIQAFNNGTAIAYIKLYNATQGSTTCGSGTPVYQGMIPAPSSGGGGYVSANDLGIAFSTAITVCVTTGFADNDTTAPAASTYVINFTYK